MFLFSSSWTAPEWEWQYLLQDERGQEEPGKFHPFFPLLSHADVFQVKDFLSHREKYGPALADTSRRASSSCWQQNSVQ